MSDYSRSVDSATSLLEHNETLIFPLSFAQQRFWILDRLEPNSAVYNIPIPLRLCGPLKVSALEQALSGIVSRHEALRATFELNDGSPAQIVHPPTPVRLRVVDLSVLGAQEREDRARQLALEDAQASFELSQGPLLRASLLKLSNDEHILLLTIHHIVFDGWSGQVLFRELWTAYDALVNGRNGALPDLPFQYSDYAVWQHQHLAGERFTTHLEYWQKQLTGSPPALLLPTDCPRPARQSYRGAKRAISLPTALLKQLKQLSQEYGVTLFMTLLTAFKVLLARYSGQDDIVVGSPVSGRDRVELESVIGLLVNTVVLRTDLAENPTFEQLLARVRETVLSAYEHQDVPFEKLVEKLNPERDLSRNPIFQVMFAFQNTSPVYNHVPGLQITPFQYGDRASSKFDLSVTVTEQADQLRVAFEYTTDLFVEPTIARMQRHFGNLLAAIAQKPDCPVANLPLMSEDEHEQVVFEWNRTAAAYESHLPIHSAFERQVSTTPRQDALILEGRSMTYQELNQRANQLAHYLILEGVRPGMRVGVALDRSPQLVIALLAILKTGASYVPLDPCYPKQRISFVLEDSAAAAIITDAHDAPLLPRSSAKLLVLEAEADRISQQPAENPSLYVPSNSTAYVIYTSGSTGTPKGVEGTHRGAMNRFAWMWRTYAFRADEVCCQKTTLGFVDSVWEIFGPLLQGVPSVIIPQEKVLNPAEFIHMLVEHRVTRLVLVPSLLRTLLDFDPKVGDKLPDLRLCTASGEEVAADLAQRFRRLFPRARLLNLYGSSEVAADVTYHEVTEDDVVTVPIGRPISNTQVYVLDRYLQPLPAGIYGHIYIGGDNLARGYCNRPELTAERFIANPVAPEMSPRLYRTGDLGRYAADGTLHYAGRSDNQVKVRGYRIELDEIEKALEAYSAVQQAAVVLRDFAGEPRLAAYVVTKPGQRATAEALRAHLEETLPSYMVPSFFMLLDQFPLTPSGKINRLALPQPERPYRAANVAPRDNTENRLLRVWQRVLGVTDIGVTDNFFELGGHSLLAVRLVSEIEHDTGEQIPLATLFQGATIEHLAKVLRAAKKPQHEMVAAVQSAGSKPPFFGVVVPGANPLGYVAMARHLGDDQPVYRIQGAGPRVRRPYTPKEFEELAAQYIRSMKTVQPHGPYYFGGMCEGARIAFDMARLLVAEGERVGMLAIFDTWVLENSQNRFLWKVGYYRARLWAFWRSSPAKKWRMLRDWVNHRVGSSRPELLWPRAYWPGKDFVPAKYSGKITLFKVPKQPFFYINDPLMGWGTRTTGSVEVQPIKSKHLALLREPHVAPLADKLSECLARARRDSETEDPGVSTQLALRTLSPTTHGIRMPGSYFGHENQQELE
ncbi:MAG TPA: amino acid adenylation domain-containing protein [Terriglobales bacterium]|nr:amino acid adenylation domain-containing protein [Terriglobales bacterium]